MEAFRAGAITDALYTACDNTKAIVQVPAFALAAPTGVTVTAGAFTAGVGHAYTVAPTVAMAGTTGEIAVTGTSWHDVISYLVFSADSVLCTREQVKMRGEINTTKQDHLIDLLIDAVARTAAVRYGREFVTLPAATRTFAVRNRLVPLRSFDLKTATTVKWDPDGDDTTLVEGTDYILLPIGGDDLTGTYDALRLSNTLNLSSDRASRFGVGSLEIAGIWGLWDSAADVPLDINMAAIETVLSWLSKPVSDITQIDGGNPLLRVPAAPQSWDFPISAHRKFASYSRNWGVY
jgi:hypothetical protein